MKSEPSLKLQKAALRKSSRLKRAGLGGEQRLALDAAINRHLLDYTERLRPGTVAAFAAFDGEPDLAPALRQLDIDGVRLALPVILDEPGRPVIGFRQWRPTDAMKSNCYGIPEPVGTLELRLSEIDLVLLPLVAWDEHGGRLGMGASFYDRLFEPFAGDDRPTRTGVGYDLQRSERLPLDPWDVRLHQVLTESGCFTCRNEGRSRPHSDPRT
jgi:5-formyltetrahydrofolate cyclo-ligase